MLTAQIGPHFLSDRLMTRPLRGRVHGALPALADSLEPDPAAWWLVPGPASTTNFVKPLSATPRTCGTRTPPE